MFSSARLRIYNDGYYDDHSVNNSAGNYGSYVSLFTHSMEAKEEQ